MSIDVPGAEPETPYLAVRDLRLRYPIASIFRQDSKGGGFDALKDVSFELRRGDRLGLIGHNGTGKSTLLRALAGVYPPTSGELVVRGERASVFSATSGFVPSATGYENIFLRGTLLGMSFEEIKARIPAIIDFAELGDWINQPVYRYSSGMTLRLAFSIITCVQADILLLDEWLGAGDANFVEKARLRMLDLVEDAGIVVLATHNLSLMRSICDQALVMENGGARHFTDLDAAIEYYREQRETRVRSARAIEAQKWKDRA